MLRVVSDQGAEQGLAPRCLGEFSVDERAAVPLLVVGQEGDEPLLAISVANMRVTATAKGPDGRVLVELMDETDGRTVRIDAPEDSTTVATDDPAAAWISAVDLIMNLQQQLSCLRDYAVIRVVQAAGRPVGDLSPSEDIRAVMPRGGESAHAEVCWVFPSGGHMHDLAYEGEEQQL